MHVLHTGARGSPRWSSQPGASIPRGSEFQKRAATGKLKKSYKIHRTLQKRAATGNNNCRGEVGGPDSLMEAPKPQPGGVGTPTPRWQSQCPAGWSQGPGRECWGAGRGLGLSSVAETPSRPIESRVSRTRYAVQADIRWCVKGKWLSKCRPDPTLPVELQFLFFCDS